MNIFEILKKDHKTVSDLMNKLEPTIHRVFKNRDELFNRIKMELNIHSELEEKLFYSELKNYLETKYLIDNSLVEHNKIHNLLNELTLISKDSDKWSEKLHQLKQCIEHHVNEEEH